MDDDNYGYHDDGMSRRSGRSGRSGNSRSRRSQDPDEGSRRSGAPPPPRSVSSRGSRRSNNNGSDPEGMSHEFGADDPDGRHYAPGVNNHNDNRGPPPPNMMMMPMQYLFLPQSPNRAQSPFPGDAYHC